MNRREEPAPVWAIMPVMSNRELTEAAISDVLAQSIPVRLLIVLQDVEPLLRERIEAIAEQEPRVLCWSHCPPLPSLAATWNHALDMVWAAGGTEAWVLNNDVRCRRDTVEQLSHVRKLTNALFITAVGVTADQYHPDEGLILCKDETARDDEMELAKGGPDFSNFLIARVGHEKYRFDEGFVPAFCEDCSTHREYMLGGDGQRIFSINLPYLHVNGGSNTLKSMSPERRQKYEALTAQARAYYERCWGGPVNHERYMVKGDPTSARDGVTNPELQAKVWASEVSRVPADGGESNATLSSSA